MTENATTAAKLTIATTGSTERLQVIIGREWSSSGRQIAFGINATLARTNQWNELKRYGYSEADEYQLFEDRVKTLVSDLLEDTDDGHNHAIKSIGFGPDGLVPNIDEESWHLLPYFVKVVLRGLEEAFGKELELIINEEHFYRLSPDTGNTVNDAKARQDRLHLQILKQVLPEATVVRDMMELERLRLGITPEPTDAVSAK